MVVSALPVQDGQVAFEPSGLDGTLSHSCQYRAADFLLVQAVAEPTLSRQ